MRLTLLFLLLSYCTSSLAQCGDCQYHTGNLVYNGDFELGNIGFETDFIYPTTGGFWGLLSNPQTYAIGPDASDFHVNFEGLDHTDPGSGNFMVINGSQVPNTEAWCQTISVEPNTEYTFSAWAQYIDLDPDGINNGTSELQFAANGTLIGSSTIIDGDWVEFQAIWDSGSNTEVEVCIMDMMDINSGNDYGLDDISVTACVTYDIAYTPFAGWSTTVCSGQSIVLGEAAQADFSYSWNLAQFLTSSTQSDPTATITNLSSDPVSYSFTVTVDSLGLGCIQTDDVTITVLPQPQPDLGEDIVICEGESATLDVGTGWDTIDWGDGEDSQTIEVDSPGVYSVTVTQNFCPSTDNITVSQPILPEIELPDYISFCEGESEVLDAGVVGDWTGGSTSQTLVVDQSGIYSFEYEELGCTTSDFTEVEVFPYPVIELGPDVVICPDETATLSLEQDWSEILWSTDENTQSITVSFPNIYTVTVTENGCSTLDWLTVSQPDLPNIDLGPDSAICEDEFITLSSGVSGIWSTGATSATIITNEPSIYWFEYSDMGCTVRDSMTLDVIAYPVVDLGDDFEICEGQAVELDINFPGTWSTGEQDSSITIYGAGLYSVQAHREQCWVFDDVVVTDIAFPEIDLGPNRQLCLGEELEFGSDAEQNRHYLWSTGDTTNFITLEHSAYLKVDVTNQCGTLSDSVQIVFEDCDYSLYIPNAFTPDQDGLNDVVEIFSHNLEVFEIWIFDRWGNMVFTTTNPRDSWMGDVLGGGYYAPNDVYFYRVQAETTKNHLIEQFGHITLIR